jgi:hypothetical protein
MHVKVLRNTFFNLQYEDSLNKTKMRIAKTGHYKKIWNAEQQKYLSETDEAAPGLPDFSWYDLPKRGKIYQMTTKYTQSP